MVAKGLALLAVLALLSPTAFARPFTGDFNGDGSVGLDDLSYFLKQFSACKAGGAWDVSTDLVPGNGLNHLDATAMVEGYLLHGPVPGRFIVFYSDRPGGQGDYDIYLYDRSAGSLVALPGLNSAAMDADPSLTPDGRYIVFSSLRTGTSQICLYDRASSALVPLPNLASAVDQYSPCITPDGQLIAFSTQTDHVDFDDVVLYDRGSNSLVSLPGLNTDYESDDWPSLTADGRYIVFSSYRPASGGSVTFVYDRNTTSMVSLPRPAAPATGDNWPTGVSLDGRYVASYDTVPGDGSDVFLYDRNASAFVTLSGLNSTAEDTFPALSSDGRYLAFQSTRSDASGFSHVYLYDRNTSSFVDCPGLNSTYRDAAPRLN